MNDSYFECASDFAQVNNATNVFLNSCQ